MNAAQRVVREIGRLLALSVVPKDVDASALAAEYADLCREANERLQRCSRHIAEGRVREAMHIAESRPSLLEQCAVLDFPGADRWAQMGQAGGWTVAEAVDSDAINTINETYASANSLEPIVKEYSGAAQNREFRTCVRLLRRLIRLAPGNQFWVDDLKAFEAKRLEELKKGLAEADAANDLDLLEEMARELDEAWLSEASHAVKAGVAQVLQRVREMAASERGAQIVERLSDAYAALNYNSLQVTILEFDKLMEEGFFKPQPELCIQYEEAREWYFDEKGKREKVAAYQRNLERLKDELSNDIPSKDVEQLYRTVIAGGGEVPEDLRRRAERAISTYHEMEYRRKRLRVTLGVLAALLTISLVSAFFGHRFYRALIGFYMPRMQLAIRQVDPDALSAIGAEIQEHFLFGRLVYQAPEVQALLLKEPELRLRTSREQANFRNMVARLTAIRNNAFIEDGEFRVLIVQGRELIDAVARLRNDPQARSELDALQAARSAHWENVLREKEGALQKLTAQTMDRLIPYAELKKGQLEALDQTLAGLAAELREADGLANEIVRLSRETEFKGSADLTVQNYEAVKVEIAELRKSIKERRDMLAQASGARELDLYLRGLKDYARSFPDDARSASFRRVLDQGGSYAYLTAFDVDGTTRLSAGALERYSDGIPPDNIFWDALLLQHATLLKNLENKWTQIRETFGGWKNDKLLYALYVFDYRDPQGGAPFSVFCFDEFTNRVSGTAVQQYYRGEVFLPRPEDERAQFAESKQGVPVLHVGNLRRLAHCDYAVKMVEKIEGVKPENADLFLLDEVAALAANDQFLNDLLKLRLIRFCGRQFVELAGEGAVPALDAALVEMTAVDDGALDWLCVKNPLVLAASQTAQEVVAKHFKDTGFIARYRLERRLRELCIERGVKWVGYVDFDDPARIRLNGTSDTEVWVLRPGASDVEIMVVGETVQGQLRIGAPLHPAEPLFAPAWKDPRNARELVRQALKDFRLASPMLKSVNWPRAWPANRQE